MLPLKKPVGAGAVAAVAIDATASAVVAMRVEYESKAKRKFHIRSFQGECAVRAAEREV